MFKVKEGIRIGAQEFVDSSRNVTAGTITASDVTISGALYGPATMYIDPAGIGDNTGTLVIRGNLQVDGTTTTINSTTVAIDDLNLQLAADAPNAAAANGAGISVGGASATLTYTSGDDRWNFNKSLNVNGSTVWHAGNLTNLNQLTNGPGYITGYTETDTLATVTGRGSSTSTRSTFNSGWTVPDTIVNYVGNFQTTDYSTFTFMSRAWSSVQGTNGLAYTFNTHNNAGGSGYGALQIYYGEGGKVETPTSFRAPIFYDSNDTGYYTDPASTSVINILDARNTARISTAGFAGIEYYNTAGGQWQAYVGTENNSGNLRFNSYNGNHNWYSNSSSIATLNSTRLRLGSPSGNPASSIVSSLSRYLEIAVNDANSTSYTYGSGVVFHHGGVSTSALSYMQPNADGGYFNFASDDSSFVGTISASSMRAPIFYDQNDTTYYLDPASTGKAMIVNGNIELTARSESWGEGIRINVPTAGTWGGVRFNRSGASGPGNWAIGYTGVNSTDDFTVWSGTTNSIQVNLDHSANLSSIGSMRAPVFYDSADTNYYVDPNSTSSMWNVNIRGDASSTNTSNQIFFWGNGSTTTSAIGFKASGGNFPNPTGNGDGYNTYLTMDTAGRGWVFRQGTGSTDFTSLYNSGWILNNGIWQANASMRAPIFYDSNDTNYYADPASTSVINTLTVSTINNIKPKTDVWHQSNEGKERFYFAPNSTTYYRTGNNFVFRNNSDSGVVTIDGSGNLRTTTGGDNYASYSLHVGGTGYAANDFRAPIFYDSNNTSYYVDPASTSNLYNVNIQGELFAANPTWGGFPLAPNLVHNSYMNKVTSGVPDGYSSLGSITIQAVHPFTKGFEGPYTPSAPAGSVNDPNNATQSNPYWYGVYTKGPRISRGGMADGWHSYGDGNLLKVTGTGIASNYTSAAHCAIYLPKELNNLGVYWIFSAFVKIVKGSAFTVGSDAGYIGVNTGYSISKATCDTGPQGWTRYTTMLSTSQITAIDGLAISMAILPDANGDIEGYIALPYLANVNYKGQNVDSWSGSIVDKLQRQGVYIQPTDFASEKLQVMANGDVNAITNIKTPIVYDSSDTNYYFDGASTTRTNVIQTNYIGVNQAYDPSWRLIVNGNAYLNGGGYGQAEGSWRAPVFYDSNDTGYYLDANSSGVALRIAGAIQGNHVDWTGEHNKIQWHSSHMYFQNMNNGYWIFRRSNGSEPFLLHADGWGQASGDWRAPVFYDSNDTAFYLNPRHESRLSGLRLDGIDNQASGTDAILWINKPNNNDWAMIVSGNLEYGINLQMAGSHSYALTAQANGSEYSRLGSDLFYHNNQIRAPIFYDYDDTNYYVNPNGTTNLNNLYIQGGVAGVSNSSSYTEAAIEVRERNFGGAQDDTWATAPRISFHWAGRVASQIAMSSGGTISILNNPGNAYENFRAANIYGQSFIDSDDNNFYVNPASTTTSLQVAGTIEQGNRYAHPNIDWGASGDSTGMVIFYVPGTTGNYGMVHMVFDIYEYNSPRTATVIVGGHNWNGGWYSTACNVVGFTDKQVRLGVKDGRYVVVFGTSGSSWSYGQIRLRKIQNGSYYDNVMDLGGNWSTTQTTTESFSNISGDLRGFRTPTALEVDGIIYGYSQLRTPIYYDYNDTGYYCDPNGSSRLNDVLPNQIYNYGWFRNQSSGNGLYNTANDAHFYSAGPNYWHINPDNGSVSIGGLIFYDQYNSTQNSSTGRKGSVYWDSAGFGLLDSTGNWSVNIHPTNYARVTIGGHNGINPYDGVTGIRLMFGGGDNTAAADYYIGTNLEYFGGTYNKLDLRWHTGIRIGAQPNYGGVRIYDSEDMGTIRFSVNKGDANTRVETGDFYAANLYDRDNTSYYIDPPGTNRVNVVHANYFLGEITDSGSGDSNAPFRFESDYSGWASLFANAPGSGTGWGTFWAGNDNPAYRYFDTSNPNEYVFVGAGVARASIDLDNGQSWFDTSVRSPIFYDSNDTSYYIDPNSTSNSALRMRGGALFGPNVTWGASLYVGTDGRPGTSAAVAVTNGNLHLDSQNGYQIFLNWYSGEPTWTGGNLGVGSASASHRLHVHGTGLATSDFRAPIFYDSDNTGYYVDPGSNANIAGQVYIGGWFRNYGTAGLYNESYGNHWYATGNDYWNLAGNNTSNVGIIFRTGGHQGTIRGYVYAENSNNIGFLNSAGSWRLRVVGDDYSLADGSSMRAQIFYDSNDTTYYADFASSSTSVNTRGAIVSGGSGSTGGGLITINGNLGSLSLHPAAGATAAEIRSSASLLIKTNTTSVVASISTSGIVSSGSITAFGSPSDRNLKENIIPLTNSLEKVRALQGVSFNWKKDTQEHTITGLDSDIGLIAQNVQEIFPELVRDQDGTLTLRERGLIAVLVEAVKEQDVKIKQLEALVETLVSKLGK